MIAPTKVPVCTVDVFDRHVSEAVGGYLLGEAGEGARRGIVFSSYCETAGCSGGGFVGGNPLRKDADYVTVVAVVISYGGAYYVVCLVVSACFLISEPGSHLTSHLNVVLERKELFTYSTSLEH